MSTLTYQAAPVKVQEKRMPVTDLRVAMVKYLYHWPLFAVALLLAFVAAFLYLKTTKPVYQIKAALLIKDEKKAPDQRSALQEIDLLNTSKITENEVEVLKSKEIISQVVKDLQLDVQYKQKNGLFYDDLYSSSPVKLKVLGINDAVDGDNIDITINNKNSFTLTTPEGEPQKILFKNNFKTNLGTFKLEPTPALLDHIGDKIRIIQNDPEKVALDYQKAIDATLPDKLATAISLTLDEKIPQRGKDILNRLIYNYKQAGTLEKNRETKSTLDFIDQRLASLTGELTDSEKGIEKFKSSRGLTDISSESQISLENQQTNDTHLNEVNVQLSVIEGIERYINSSQNLGKAPATLGITDPALSSLISKLAELQLQREKLLATTPETNPDFDVINRQISSTKDAIKENVKSIKSSLTNTQQKLSSFDSHIVSSIKNIPTQEREYISIKRQQAIKESLYTYLLQKREEVSVSYASTLTNDRVVDQAYSGPAKKAQMPVAFALALFLGFGIPASILYGRYNGKIKDLQEIKDAIDLPIIGELPFESLQDGKVINSKATTATSEQFRALRIKLHYLFGETGGGRVALVTSSIPGEGKSFVSGNLASALAHSGKKTVILELDMRKPKIAQAFNLSKDHAGIGEYLKGTATLANIIQNCGFDVNMDIISSGAILQNPSELLEKPQLKQLIDTLRTVYDYIIIDSPPARLVPDAMLLTKFTDISLYIIRQGITTKAELGFLNELNEQKQLSNIHVVFNGIQRMKYGYGYDYNRNSYYDTQQRGGLSSRFANFSDRF